MIARVAARVILLMAGLALATALVVGAMAGLASTNPAHTSMILERDHVAAVQRAIEAPAEPADDSTPSPAIVLVLAGIVMLAALPPVQRVHVYHRTYQRSDRI
jgi:hypothetical protein